VTRGIGTCDAFRGACLSPPDVFPQLVLWPSAACVHKEGPDQCDAAAGEALRAEQLLSELLPSGAKRPPRRRESPPGAGSEQHATGASTCGPCFVHTRKY
jgi:hypothetical protein